MTDPSAQAGASLYQAFLPNPTFADGRHLNAFLLQLQTNYSALVFRSDLNWADLRLVCIADSSLGNVAKYSQGGFFILLCSASKGTLVCGNCCILSYKGSKSKRVASSTLHAECLALVSGTEEATFLQTWLLELVSPQLSTMELINSGAETLVPIVGLTDCKDLLDVITKSAITAVSNKAMLLYIACLRELRETKRIDTYGWVDTRDNVANAQTKLNADGTLPSEPVTHMLKHASWEPREPFRWGQSLCDPTHFVHVPLKLMPVSKTVTNTK